MKKSLLFVLGSCLFIVVCAHAQQRSTIELKGPNELILLGQKLTQLYQRNQPGVTIHAQGGGTQAAVSQLLKGEIDIAQSHGELRSETGRGLLAVPIGMEAIVVYVNASNPVSELTLAQLRGIYTGEILNWKQLGGPDQRIMVYGGESTGGLTSYFSEFILHGDVTFSYMGKSSTKDLLEAVGSHPEAIGFAAIGLASRVKAVRLRTGAAGTGVEPTFDSIRSGQYPFSRYIYWYLAREPRGRLREFCEWMFSSEGQLVVEGAGFQPLPPDKRMMARQRLGFSAIGATAAHAAN